MRGGQAMDQAGGGAEGCEGREAVGCLGGARAGAGLRMDTWGGAWEGGGLYGAGTEVETTLGAGPGPYMG